MKLGNCPSFRYGWSPSRMSSNCLCPRRIWRWCSRAEAVCPGATTSAPDTHIPDTYDAPSRQILRRPHKGRLPARCIRKPRPRRRLRRKTAFSGRNRQWPTPPGDLDKRHAEMALVHSLKNCAGHRPANLVFSHRIIKYSDIAFAEGIFPYPKSGKIRDAVASRAKMGFPRAMVWITHTGDFFKTAGR
jgi:hypothetical protein